MIKILFLFLNFLLVQIHNVNLTIIVYYTRIELNEKSYSMNFYFVSKLSNISKTLIFNLKVIGNIHVLYYMDLRQT